MIAIDRGRSSTKIVYSGGMRLEWPPVAAPLPASPDPALLDHVADGDGMIVLVDGEWWAVGAGAGAAALDERKADAAARAVVAAALMACGLRDGQVDVGLAVPAALASSEASRLASSVAGHLNATSASGARVDVKVRATVLAEPAAAAMVVLLAEDGTPRHRELAATVAVVDLGHRTLDLVVLRGGRPLGPGWSHPSGGVVAYERWLRSDVEPHLGFLLTDAERAAVVSAAARGQVPTVRGRRLPAEVLAALSQHRRHLAGEVVRAMRTALSGVAYQRLVITGGLAEWLAGELLAEWPHATIPPEPRWAVAEGLLRYLRYRGNRSDRTRPDQVGSVLSGATP